GFQVGGTVDFQVSNLTNGNTYTPPWSVTDGGTGDLDGVADGHIRTSWLVVSDALNSTLKLTAAGETSGLTAENTFTDAGSATLTSVTVGAQSAPVTYGTLAGSATFIVTVTRSSNGNQTADLSLNGTFPSGMGAAFFPSTVNFGPGGTNNSPTSTLR